MRPGAGRHTRSIYPDPDTVCDVIPTQGGRNIVCYNIFGEPNRDTWQPRITARAGPSAPRSDRYRSADVLAQGLVGDVTRQSQRGSEVVCRNGDRRRRVPGAIERGAKSESGRTGV